MRQKILALIAIVIFSAGAVSAQTGSVNRADKLFANYDFEGAAALYEKAVDKDPTNLHCKVQLAECHRALNNTVEAERWYGLLVQMPNAKPEYNLYYAQALRSNQKYDEAETYFNKYALLTNNGAAKEIASKMDRVNDLEIENPAYEISLMNLNTSASDFGPTFHNGTLYFTSNRDKDVFISRQDDWTDAPFLQIHTSAMDESGNFATPELLEAKNVNGRYHDGPIAFDRNLNDMYLTRSNYLNGKVRKDAAGTVNLKIYRCVFVPSTGEWGEDLLNDFPHNSDLYSCAHPTITKDGQTMYFTSDMPGGYGASDIYMCKKEGGVWGDAVNLGPEINTFADDMFPYIADDGTLYFASAGHYGLGGLDLYSTSGSEGNWSTPTNLGSPLNTSSDDFALTLDPTTSKGYFSSNRPGGYGNDDIYSFTKEGILLSGMVYEANSNKPIPDAVVKLVKLPNKDAGSVNSGVEGDFDFTVEPYTTYKIVVEKDGYFPTEVEVPVKNDQIVVNIPITVDQGLQLEVLVRDAQTKTPLSGSDVELIESESGAPATKITKADGKVTYGLEADKRYKVFASKDGYLSSSSELSTFGVKSPYNMLVTLDLTKGGIGDIIKIENIYYDLDKWAIRPDAAVELDKLVKLMEDNPAMEIELSSHTDCRAKASYNMWLSAKRAESAVNYIISRGISPVRLIAAGYGESSLVNNCACEDGRGLGRTSCTESQHQENRRTEFKILKL